MKKGKFKAIIYLISFTVLVTLGIQVYRNMQNYQLNKQRLVIDVQNSLNNAIEAYYAGLAKDDETLNIILTDSMRRRPAFVTGLSSGWIEANRRQNDDHEHTSAPFDSALDRMSFFRFNTGNRESLDIAARRPPNSVKFSLSTGSRSDSVLRNIDPASISSVTVFSDSTFREEIGFKQLADNLIFSMARPMNLDKLSEYVNAQLTGKGLDLDFGLRLFSFDNLIDTYNNPEDPRFVMATNPNSTYQFEARRLEMRFTNASLTILRRGLTDLIISLLISVTVIGVLLYLYKVINEQKQLAEIKNDLISNITHEFKTPIATVASAIEGISHFNQQNDPAKTKKYLDISNQQLKKLNVMVEKLLETATLETDALELNKTPVNLSQLLHSLIEKYRMIGGGKQLDFQDHSEDAIIEADAFHLENALSNLIDNALKYGGDEVLVTLAYQNNSVRVVVQDNGGFIEKSQQERVFDKFYRIPKGNRHDVKGFGIGLYYTRKIIEKHGGTINLSLAHNVTSFEVAI